MWYRSFQKSIGVVLISSFKQTTTRSISSHDKNTVLKRIGSISGIKIHTLCHSLWNNCQGIPRISLQETRRRNLFLGKLINKTELLLSLSQATIFDFGLQRVIFSCLQSLLHSVPWHSEAFSYSPLQTSGRKGGLCFLLGWFMILSASNTELNWEDLWFALLALLAPLEAIECYDVEKGEGKKCRYVTPACLLILHYWLLLPSVCFSLGFSARDIVVWFCSLSRFWAVRKDQVFSAWLGCLNSAYKFSSSG